jgi:shikimate dehydrogenase
MTALVINGATRLIPIIGDPIAQVKSPAGVTHALQQRGVNAVCVPVHVAADDVEAFINAAERVQNIDGIIVTVPHKFAAYRHCSSATDRAHLLGSVQILRRNADRTWHGDHLDGEGFVAGIRAAGCRPEGRRALLVGAGGAGSAIALALLDAGVATVAIHDTDARRRDALRAKLAPRYGNAITAGSSDPTGYTLLVNATPRGMQVGDPFPIEVAKLAAPMFVADVVTAPATTPLIEAARAAGCGVQVGAAMFEGVNERMVRFLLQTDDRGGEPRNGRTSG